MALVVQKFGGTSVANIERIENVAKKVIREYEKGNQVIVTVSAMAGETNRLIALAKEITDLPDERELDVLVSTGEQVSVALLAITLIKMGYKAKSYLGHQIKILTDSAFTKARILDIETEKIKRDLDNGYIVVVAGFQGVDKDGNITTLGRGGSDTTGVALAAAFKADVCDIYTDVDGVYTTDPRIYNRARKLKKISYDEMLELASLGSKVLQIRSVELAKKYKVPVHVRSSFSDEPGTIVCEEDSDMEKVVVSGVSCNKDEARITLVRVPDRPGVAAKLFGAISAGNIVVDMIIQNSSIDGTTDLTFTVPKSDLKKTLNLVKAVADEIGAKDVIYDEGIAKVSIVGLGMRSHSGVAAKMFEVLGNAGINILMISTSEIKISCAIDEKYTELAVRILHDAFELDKENSNLEK
ncbi:MAG: aspartate kinase [Proteobacteria bacterium]|nr:aspartate kinase [Pseudomonadota bacterium]